MLRHLRIGPRLLLAPALGLVLLIVATACTWQALVRQNEALTTTVQLHAVRIKAAGDLLSEARHAHAGIYQLLTWLSASISEARVQHLQAELQARLTGVERELARVAGRTPPDSAERLLLEQSRGAFAVYSKAVQDVVEIARADHSVSVNAMVKAERAFEGVAAGLSRLAQLEQQLSEQANERARADYQRVSLLVPALAVLAIVMSVALGLAVRRSMLSQIAEIEHSARQLASGNLVVTARDYGEDELSRTARALDDSIRHLNRTLVTIRDSAQGINHAARSMAGANADLSFRTALQVRTLERASERLNELDLATQDDGEPGGPAEAALDGVSAAIVEMSQMSRQSSMLVRDAAQAARGLQQQALMLSKAVAAFRLDEVGPPPPRPAPPLPPEPVATPNRGERPHLRLATVRQDEGTAQ
jgi:methyl-accepting chemotaxis protein